MCDILNHALVIWKILIHLSFEDPPNVDAFHYIA